MLSASVFWAGNGIGSKILFRPDGAHFDAVGLFTARAAWSLPIFLAMAWLASAHSISVTIKRFISCSRAPSRPPGQLL